MTITNFKEFSIEGYELRELAKEDSELLQDLCQRCMGNNNIIVGSSREENQGAAILNGLPEGKTFEDKHDIGLFENGKLLGVLDMVRDYPVKGELVLGLLMIDPQVTGRGLRGKVHQCVVNWAKMEGFDKLRIDVMGDNGESLEFWKRIGYTETQKVNLKLVDKYVEVVILNYRLS